MNNTCDRDLIIFLRNIHRSYGNGTTKLNHVHTKPHLKYLKGMFLGISKYCG
jgi:hypothetical protein